MLGTEIRNHDVHIGNSGAMATSSMRKSIVLSNGANNVTHEVNPSTGNLNLFRDTQTKKGTTQVKIFNTDTFKKIYSQI